MPKLISDFDERLKSLHVSVGSFLRVLKRVAFSRNRVELDFDFGQWKIKIRRIVRNKWWDDDDDDGGGKVETID